MLKKTLNAVLNCTLIALILCLTCPAFAKQKTSVHQPVVYELDLYTLKKKITFKPAKDNTAKVTLKAKLPKKTYAGDTLILKWKASLDADLSELSMTFFDQTEVIANNISARNDFDGFKVIEIKEPLPKKTVITLSCNTESKTKLIFTKRFDHIDLEKLRKPQEVVEVQQEPESVPEPKQAAEPAPVQAPEHEQEEEGFSFVPSDSDGSVQRYKKEYLQDYAVTDEFEIITADTTENKLIENPNAKDSKGRTDLMKAAASGNEWQVKNLLESGAKVNLQDNDGWTALMYAARYSDSLATMNLLLDAKADTKILNKYDSSAFLLAVCYGNNPQITAKLMEYYSPADKELIKAFIFLLSSNYSFNYVMKAKINLFLEKEIPINTFYNGKTPLMYAAQYASSTEVIQILLNHEAIKTLRSTEGKTVFDYAKENTKLRHDDIYWSLNSQR